MKSPSVFMVAPDASRARDLAPVFDELGLAHEIASPDRIGRAAPGRHSVLWLAAGPDPHPEAMSSAALPTVRAFLAAGCGVFAEFVTGFTFVAQGGRLRKTGASRLIVAEGCDGEDAVRPGTILLAQDTVTIDVGARSAAGAAVATGPRVIAEFGNALGVNTVIARYGEPWPGILGGSAASGRWAWASFRVTDFGRRQFSPQAGWRALSRDLLRWLLPADLREGVERTRIPVRAHSEPRTWALPGPVSLIVETAPGAAVSAPGVTFGEVTPGRFAATVQRRPGALRLPVSVARAGRRRTMEMETVVEDRAAAYRRALDRNIAWFERSGVLVAPDGSLGVTEWISGPDGEGNRLAYGKGQLFAHVRADCEVESGLAYLRYGALAGDAARRGIGRALMTRALDFQRLAADDEHNGLWYTRGRAGPPYEDDEAWVVICLLAAWRDTGEHLFLERGLLAARATLRVYGAGSPKAAEANDPEHEHPSTRGQMYAAWLYAWGITGEREYLDAAVPGVRRMIESFRMVQHISVSRTNEATRWLLPLALAFAYTGEHAFADDLAVTAGYLRSRRATCGAIQEECRNPPDRFDGNDLGLTHDNTETISDQLYTTSWAALGLWVAWCATGDALYREDFEAVTDYLVRIQDRSGDPRTDGGWARGFDYEAWECHGSNADHAWSAWCMETGWANAIIDLALTLPLTGDSFYEKRAPR